jgi:hypothetical protein
MVMCLSGASGASVYLDISVHHSTVTVCGRSCQSNVPVSVYYSVKGLGESGRPLREVWYMAVQCRRQNA